MSIIRVIIVAKDPTQVQVMCTALDRQDSIGDYFYRILARNRY